MSRFMLNLRQVYSNRDGSASRSEPASPQNIVGELGCPLFDVNVGPSSGRPTNLMEMRVTRADSDEFALDRSSRKRELQDAESRSYVV